MTPAATTSTVPWTIISDFAWDQGEYNSPKVTVYVELEGVGGISKDNVTCTFTKDTFDLQVVGLSGKNYRLLQDNLDKDIIPGESKFLVKANKIVLKLAKTKGEYSFDNWTSLSSKKTKGDKAASKSAASGGKADPMGGIMDMMKEMYDSGDDKMKKIIGEAMEKSRTGEKITPSDGLGSDMPAMPDLSGMPGLGDLPGME